MPRCFFTRRLAFTQMFRTRFLYLVTCSFIICIPWMRIDHTSPTYTEDLVREALENVAKDSRYSEVFRKQSKLPKNIKYILLWTDYEYAPFYFFEHGQRSFIKNNCSDVNCYITPNRDLLTDITKFDAIAFNGRTMSVRDLPKKRAPHQKFIYVNMESSDNYPVCDYRFDGFFNWTMTYKLDSDIPIPYIAIKNQQREIIGPHVNMIWPEHFLDNDDEFSSSLLNKTKAAAWFVSHCATRSGRDHFVKHLQKALEPYGLAVDVYGSCGPLKCPKKRWTCNFLLERDYFFYMSLENSFSEDYVTEKVLTALMHNTVPIVFGGANYSRFLPPGSFIDARKFDPMTLAAIIYEHMKVPELYRNFFRWKKHYSFSDPSKTENICALCAALNEKNKIENVATYKHFRNWWNPNYLDEC